jgi:hypothetical protein
MSDDKLSNDPVGLEDCSRRVSAVEGVLNSLRAAFDARITQSDAERAGLAGLVAAERERASGYAFRISALEGVKPLGINVVLVTAAAVIGVIALVGGGYLSLMHELDLKDTLIMQIQVDAGRRDLEYLDKREAELAVELRNADRDSWIRQDETRQKLAAVEARQEMIRNQMTFAAKQ